MSTLASVTVASLLVLLALSVLASTPSRPGGDDLSAQWPAALYGLWQFGLGVVVFTRRPLAPAARAMLVGGSGVLLWTAGALAGATTPLPRAVTAIGCTVAWGGLLHFALTFPRTHPWLRGRAGLAGLAYAVPVLIGVAGAAVAGLSPGTSAGTAFCAAQRWAVPLLAVVALAHHHLTGDDGVRRRTGLVALAAAEGLAAYVLLALLPVATSGQPLVSPALQPLLVLPLPLAQSIALLRRRMLDIDVIVHRSLVWGTVTLLVVGAYVGGVWLIGAVVSGTRPSWASLVVTGVVAIVVQPARQFAQRAVDRFVYGHRGEPYRVLAALSREIGDTTGPSQVLPFAVREIGTALRLPWVCVEVRGGEPIAWPPAPAHPDPALPVWRCPLVHQGTLVGQLAVAARDQRGLGSSDQQVLEDLAAQLSVATHAVQLAGALQRSRERLASAREEERHHLHHDLHDGVGPTLAGVALKLELTLERLPPERTDLRDVLTQLLAETQDAVRDVRRIVYGLRPPAVLELGLGAALEHRAQSFAGPGDSARVRFTIRADGLPVLTPAVQVAAYRIAVEAMTNVIRHAGARRCVVDVREVPEGGHVPGRVLRIRVADDGAGVAGPLLPGVGVSSMIERASELGGWCRVVGANRTDDPDGERWPGAVVVAELPLPDAADPPARTGDRPDPRG